MPLPIRHLPIAQNWECRGCGKCCREYEVAVTDEERRRIEGQGWENDPAIGKTRLFVRKRFFWSRSCYLAHRKDRGCVFLSENNRCKIHEKFGAEAKPLACRLFPFALVPAGDHWRVGLRYSCPSAAGNFGPALPEHAEALAGLAEIYEEQQKIAKDDLAAPPLGRRQHVEWADLFKFVRVLRRLLQNREDRLELRWRKCLALASLCRQATFDAVRGDRLQEFLDLVTPALAGEVPSDPNDMAPPGWIGRILFRQLAAIYGRVDRGPERGPASRSRRALFLSGCRFAIGKGRIPRVNAHVADTTFAQVEQNGSRLTAAAENILERYYLVKLDSLQFFGRIHYRWPFWEGLDSLALTFPLIVFLARSFRKESGEEAVSQALQIVDDHYGFNPILRTWRYRLTHRLLSRQNEIARLIAQYGR